LSGERGTPVARRMETDYKCRLDAVSTTELQGYLAHKNQRPPRTLQQDYALGPTVVLGGGQFLTSEVTLHCSEPRACVPGALNLLVLLY